MRVRDIMRTNVETVDQEELAEAANNRMRVKRIRHLVVLSGSGIVGVLSERDLGGKDREAMRFSHKVLNFMTPYAVKARPEMLVRQAAKLMRGWSIGCLPVVDRGRLVGIITVSDLLDLVAKGGEQAPARKASRPASKRTRAGKG
jgi:acetoin utilization protein AcuB